MGWHDLQLISNAVSAKDNEIEKNRVKCAHRGGIQRMLGQCIAALVDRLLCGVPRISDFSLECY